MLRARVSGRGMMAREGECEPSARDGDRRAMAARGPTLDAPANLFYGGKHGRLALALCSDEVCAIVGSMWRHGGGIAHRKLELRCVVPVGPIVHREAVSSHARALRGGRRDSGGHS